VHPRPGLAPRIVGTLAAVAGAVTILENYNRPDYEVGFFVSFDVPDDVTALIDA